MQQGHTMNMDIKAWQALIAVVIAIAGGGGAGTFAATAQVDERLREQERTQTRMEADIGYIKESIKNNQENIESIKDGNHEIERKVDRILIELEKTLGDE